MRACAIVATLSVLAGGCLASDTVECGDRVCRAGKVCAPDGMSCVSQEQIDVCASSSEGDACAYVATPAGVCHADVCVPAGCGNLVVEPGEKCDDGNRISLDGCRSDCLSLEACGDGTLEPALAELCDCGDEDNLSPACVIANSEEPGAVCRTDCRPAGCGDDVQDPGELCDDGNLVYGDGCRGDCQGRFQKMETPTAKSIRAVFVLAPDDAFAVGDQGLILRFDGTSWTQMDAPEPAIYDGVWASGPDDAYAVSQDGVAHFDGNSWSTIPQLAMSFSSVWGSGPDDIYVSGSGGVYHFTGTSPWVQMDDPCDLGDVYGLDSWGSGPDDVYISTEQSNVCHWNGDDWTEPPDFNSAGNAITGSGPDDVFIFDGVMLHHYSGGSWTEIEVPGFISDITSLGPGEVLAVGSAGVILIYGPDGWTNLASPTEAALNNVHAAGPSTVFAVGEFGVIIH